LQRNTPVSSLLLARRTHTVGLGLQFLESKYQDQTSLPSLGCCRQPCRRLAAGYWHSAIEARHQSQ